MGKYSSSWWARRGGGGGGVDLMLHQEDSSSCGHILLRDEKTLLVCACTDTGSVLIENFDGEFDPGSGRTLAVRLMHASRGRSNRSVRFGCGNRRTGA